MWAILKSGRGRVKDFWGRLKRPNKRFWSERCVWITAPSVTAAVILLRFVGLLQMPSWLFFDQYMRWRPEVPPDERIAIVGIDDADVEKIGQAIIPDGVYAQLLAKLQVMQPRAIGLDIYRDVPVPPGHEQLVEIFAQTPNIVGIQKVVGSSPREVVAPPPVLKEKGQVGANDLIVDADSRVRRGFLYMTSAGERVYSFGFYLALIYLEAEGIIVEDIDETKFKLGKQVFAPFESNDGDYVRSDAGGFQLLVNYRGPSQHFETVSLSDILEDRVPPDWGRDRVILIGAVGESFNDLFYTPYSGGVLILPRPMSGVEIHANITSQIISAARGDRALFESWSEPIEWLWILLWSFVGASLTWTLRGSKCSHLQRVSAAIILLGGLWGSTYGAFLAGWWIPVVPPLVAIAGSAVAVTSYIAHSAGQIRKTFGRYLTDEVVTNLLEHPEGLKMGGERRKITILTSDLRGFTATSERLPPEEVVKILNFYLSYMADAITSYQGTIDEFMGDGILVLFGAPTQRPDDAQRAIACAIAMQLAMVKVNEQMQEWGYAPLLMGIGINTGEVVVGNIGSEKRTKYGVVGSQVNLTYRIESYTTGGQILISEPTLHEGDPSIIKVNSEKQVKPKGVKNEITIYDIGAIEGNYNLFLPQKEEVFKCLESSIALQYALLDGKNVGDSSFPGSLVQLSESGGLVKCDPTGDPVVVSPMSNIKLNLIVNPGSVSEDIYAKVTEKEAEEKGCFYIYFTAKPPDIQAMFEKLYKSLK